LASSPVIEMTAIEQPSPFLSSTPAPSSSPPVPEQKLAQSANKEELATGSADSLFHDERDWATNWKDVFKARALHSSLILGCIVFLKVLSTTIFALRCVKVSDVPEDASIFLTADGSFSDHLYIDIVVVCYSSSHLPVVVIAYLIILAYGVGFPVLCFVVLRRAFNTMKASALPTLSASESVKSAAASSYRGDVVGFLYRGVNEKFFYFRLLSFLANWSFALQLVFSGSSAVVCFFPLFVCSFSLIVLFVFVL
jgi:hypothetical protein